MIIKDIFTIKDDEGISQWSTLATIWLKKIIKVKTVEYPKFYILWKFFYNSFPDIILTPLNCTQIVIKFFPVDWLKVTSQKVWLVHNFQRCGLHFLKYIENWKICRKMSKPGLGFGSSRCWAGGVVRFEDQVQLNLTYRYFGCFVRFFIVQIKWSDWIMNLIVYSLFGV